MCWEGNHNQILVLLGLRSIKLKNLPSAPGFHIIISCSLRLQSLLTVVPHKWSLQLNFSSIKCKQSIWITNKWPGNEAMFGWYNISFGSRKGKLFSLVSGLVRVREQGICRGNERGPGQCVQTPGRAASRAACDSPDKHQAT